MRDLKQFLDFVQPLTRQAKGVEVSALGYRSKNGFRVITGRVTTLDVAKEMGIRRFKDAGAVFGVSVRAGRGHVAAVLKALETGELLIPGSPGPDSATLTPHSQSQFLWYDKPYLEIEQAKKYDSPWPAHVATVEGGPILVGMAPEEAESLAPEVAAVDKGLASGVPPYPSLLSLCADLRVHRYDSLEGMTRTWLELVVPIRVKLRSLDVDPVASKLTVLIDAVGPLRNDSTVAVMPLRALPKQRILVKASSFRVVRGSPGVRQRVFPLPKATGSVTVSLSLGRTTIDSLTEGLHDVRRSAHALVDSKGERLQEWLFDPDKQGKKQQDKFELAVAWLFHLMGFAVIPYGTLGPCADLLATSADGRLVLVVECSVALPDRQKLKHLRHRRDELARLYEDRGIKARVAPVLVTCAEGALLDTEQAEEDGILLIEGDELQDLFDALLQGRSHRYFLKSLEEMAKECDPEDPWKLSQKYSERLHR